ncbi:hypothetical protein [Pseudonocardia cypriaca]|uniref:Uncharacterized protein n=1 Tax=Pseudonocardia cypriaca TaxID=882449 RepID=A0A543GDG2_9PSEU|nr:hypothetical protein [Pseudonocardia cypriaca]TQM44118.1 hypothetical protein FB388_1480 [Pseudonocardia cypriaca]
MATANPRVDQYEAAIAQARQIVERDGRRLAALAFHPEDDGTPEVVKAWASRFAMELSVPITRKCPHGGWSQVHTVFGSQPNVAHCLAECTPKRMRELIRDARRRDVLECDFCHCEADSLGAVVFDVAAVVVRMKVCAYCLAGLS